uniref:DUF4794 domain-containing protein n=1 Tax=Stomoxys calcitrans TaxID=35570 RepID=A0A1I8PVF2_STOCA
MLKYLLLSALVTIHTVVWGKPAPATIHHHGQLTPHVVIMTPQAQLQLEPVAHGSPLIQHLSPFTRFVAPHEETIIYVPTSALGGSSVPSIISPYQFEARSVAPRQASTVIESITNAINNPNEIINGLNPNGVFEAIQNSVTNAITNAAHNSPCDTLNTIATNSPQEWAENISNSAGIAGAALQSAKAETAAQKPQSNAKLAAAESPQPQALPKVQHIEYEIPITPILAHEPRHQHQHYASVIGPSVPHVVDLIQTPIFLAPSIPTIKGRSLALDESKPIIALPIPEPPKPEALALQPILQELQQSAMAADKKEEEKLPELGRFLEADDSLKQEKLSEAISPIKELPPQAEKLETEIPALKPQAPEDNKLDEKPQIPLAA